MCLIVHILKSEAKHTEEKYISKQTKPQKKDNKWPKKLYERTIA
jgi:hypothetical protein